MTTLFHARRSNPYQDKMFDLTLGEMRDVTIYGVAIRVWDEKPDLPGANLIELPAGMWMMAIREAE